MHAPLKRHAFQPRDHATRLIAIAHEKTIKAKIAQALAHARAMVPRKSVVSALKSGYKVDRIMRLINFDHLSEVYKEPFDAISATLEDAGKHGAADIGAAFKKRGVRFRYGRFHNHDLSHRHRNRHFFKTEVAKDIGDEFAFDRFDDSTQELLRQYQDELIAELEMQARDSIETAVLQGVRSARSASDIADAIRDSISLTKTQIAAVENFRRMVEDGDPDAMRRALRDTAMDDRLQDAIDGDDLSDAEIDGMVDAYAANYLDYRAGAIARTESTRAANLGMREAYSQAIERGAFPAAAVRRFWLLDLDEKTCPVCRSIPELNPRGVAVDEYFESDDGQVDGAPVHTSCRCSEQYETNLDMIDDDLE